MTEQEQKAFDAAYADALKQSRPGTIRDIARLCYESAITAANAVSHPKATEPAEKYARNLCISMARKFYPEVTQFEPLDDLFGLLTQIDNMTTGLVRPQATEPAPSTYEPIGWADWQGNMVTEFRQWSDGSSDEIVVYRKLAAAPEAKQ